MAMLYTQRLVSLRFRAIPNPSVQIPLFPSGQTLLTKTFTLFFFAFGFQ